MTMSCRLKFRRYTLAALFLVAVGAAAQPVELKAFDKMGNEVGPYSHGFVYVRLDESTIIAIQLEYLNAESARGQWQDVTRMMPKADYHPALYYTERDCIGTAYIVYPNATMPGVKPMQIVVDKPNQVLVYLAEARPPLNRKLASYLNGTGGCRNKPAVRSWVVPVVNTVDLTARFPVPYTLR
jgi:hypothetical protein